MDGDAGGTLNEALLTAASPWGVSVRVLGETTSSNDEVLRLGESGEPEGTLLFAERQTAGRGRLQRPWDSAPGLGLWFSLLLRLPVNDATIPSLSAFAAVAVVRTLRTLGLGGAGIKAPNDVLVGGKKVAGILIETRPGSAPFAVAGIGLNVNHREGDFPPELRDRATSLALASGSALDRHRVASLLLRELGEARRLIEGDPAALKAAWNGMLLPDSAVGYDSSPEG